MRVRGRGAERARGGGGESEGGKGGASKGGRGSRISKSGERNIEVSD